MDILEQLADLPKEWAYVAVKDKRPYQRDWQNNPLNRSQLFKEISSNNSTGIGVCCGTPSGGLLFLDHDGASAERVLLDWGLTFAKLPASWTVTSGRVGRFQIIYKVPEKYWSKIKTKKFKSGVKDEDGSVEQVELRWNGCQSIVCGKHPTTDGYKWMDGRSPHDISEIAEAPLALIEKMFDEPPKTEVLNSDSDKVRSLLQSINPNRLDDYDDWIKIGMAAHSVGDHSLLHDWEALSEKNGKYQSGECRLKWDSFKSSGISIGTLQKFAQEDGWIPTFAELPNSLAPLPVIGKLRRLEGHEVINFLKSLPKKEEIRFNTLSRLIEIGRKPMQKIDRFYLDLQDVGIKISKELAIDCIMQVAEKNEYDPVKEYLEIVSKVTPYPIDRIASEFLRPDDINLSEPTIYDKMIKCCLIGAVQRIYEPGCKHDTATVLIGKQGIRKSTFWRALFGQFFSDGLGDLSCKDDLLALHRCWGMEWSEIDYITGKKHASFIKAFIVTQIDPIREPYGRTMVDRPRKCVLVGSSNKDSGLLIDDTGNRRFHVIPTTAQQIPTEQLETMRDAIWSGAIAAYRNNENNFLSDADSESVDKENEEYLIESPWLAVITKWLDTEHNPLTDGDITTELLLTKAVDKPIERQTRSDQMQVASILRSLDYEKKRKRIHGTPRWVFFKKE